MEVIPKGNKTELAKFLRPPLWHNLVASLVRRSKIDLYLVCLQAHHALERALYVSYLL